MYRELLAVIKNMFCLASVAFEYAFEPSFGCKTGSQGVVCQNSPPPP